MGSEMKFLVRSFSNVEPQKLRLGLLSACFLVSLTYFSMTKPFVVILPTMNSLLSSNFQTTFAQEAQQNATLVADVRCNVSNPISDFCEKFDVLLLERNSTTRNESVSTSQDLDVGKERSNLTERSTRNESVSTSQDVDVGKERSNLTERSYSHNDAKLVRNEAAPYILSDQLLDTKKSIDVTKIDINPTITKPLCDFSNRRADTCELTGDIRITGKNFTVLLASSHTNESYTVRPYPRKTDGGCMSNVHQVHVLSSVQNLPTCTVNHTVPALVFSDQGYTGNYFHDFTDVLVPLFLTARQYDGNVQFLVTDFRWWWVDKYLPVFNHLSRFPIIDLDKDDNVRCFPNAIVGLKAHNDLTIDPRLAPLSMVDFTSFMRQTYSLDRPTPVRPRGEKPRLLIIARGRTRRFTNLEKIVRSAEKTGFEVVVAENGGGAKIAEFARIVNSCDVMMGVHGAGLTNLVFLPTNAVFIQVVPWGKLDWVAGTSFGGPARDMKLKYLEYSIGVNESTLVQQYSMDDPVIADPMSLHRLGWVAMGDVYLVKQNVRLDVRRFRKVLSKAMKLVRER